MTSLADRVAQVWIDAVRLHATRTPSREAAEVAGIPVVTLGLPTSWATSAHALAVRPDPAAIAAAMDWLTERASSYAVFVRAAAVAGLPLDRLGLVPDFELLALAMPLPPSRAGSSRERKYVGDDQASSPLRYKVREPVQQRGQCLIVGSGQGSRTPPPTEDRLQIDLAADHKGRDEFVEAYAGSGLGFELAGQLVAAADLADPAFGHLVGRLGGQTVGRLGGHLVGRLGGRTVGRLGRTVRRLSGQTVGCALLRLVDDGGYISAVGVLPAYRRRGYGSALTRAAGDLAAQRGADLAVIHATEASRALYERLGYRYIDTHVALVLRR